MTTQVADLNQTFGVAGRIEFVEGPSGMAIAQLASAHASASIALDGAQVLTFQPNGHAPVLFVSEQATYTRGKSVRGGIPVCWPWFGGVRNDPDRPFHGFARMLPWQVRSSQASGDITSLELGLTENDVTRRYWPHSFDLRLVVSLGAALRVDLIARNTEDEPVTVGGALHSYLRVGEIDQVTIAGLEDTTYIDMRDEKREKRQDGAVRITDATDRIYLDTTATCVIDDAAQTRRIVIAKEGSRSTVVWNPWVDDARAMADMRDDEYRHMVCVETTNAADDVIALAPGEEHSLSAIIRAEAHG